MKLREPQLRGNPGGSIGGGGRGAREDRRRLLVDCCNPLSCLRMFKRKGRLEILFLQAASINASGQELPPWDAGRPAKESSKAELWRTLSRKLRPQALALFLLPLLETLSPGGMTRTPQRRGS